tara:strand:+ start:646 stop:1158 length:513 start_codon:yes stop_codon:yes gene_type:complete
LSYLLEDFCEDCSLSLANSEMPQEEIRRSMEKLLSETDFIEKYFSSEAEVGINVIHEDDKTGFQVLTHIYANGKESPPHDHGTSWAVYGQAVKHTDMTIWRRTDNGANENQAIVEPEKTFRLNPTMAGIFEIGKIHSIKFPDGARFLRVTGTNLNKITTRSYNRDECREG